MDLAFGWLQLHRYGNAWSIDHFIFRMLVVAVLVPLLLTWLVSKQLGHKGLTVVAHLRGASQFCRWPTRHIKTFFMFLILVAVVSCRKQQTIKITDTTKSCTLILAPAEGAFGRGVSLSIGGRIDGFARIWYSDSTNEVSGRIDVSYNDNYSTNVQVHYVPAGVRTGQVTIKYAFH